MLGLTRIVCLLGLIDSRSAREMCTLLDCSRATLKRDLTVLRELSVVIEYDSQHNVYRVKDAGIFNYELVCSLVSIEDE